METQGVVSFYSFPGGFGFIRISFKNDVFFHVKQWESDLEPKIGMRVTFERGPGHKPGQPDQALRVKIVSAEGQAGGAA
jgi:cold shock CspA family protein